MTKRMMFGALAMLFLSLGDKQLDAMAAKF